MIITAALLLHSFLFHVPGGTMLQEYVKFSFSLLFLLLKVFLS